MLYFLHTPDKVRIVNGALEWRGTPAAFQTLEPEYPGLPSGATVRYQTVDLQYYEDATGRHPDTIDCLGYCDQSYLTVLAAVKIDHNDLDNIGTWSHTYLDGYVTITQNHIENEDVHLHLQELGWRAACQFFITTQGMVTFSADTLTWPLLYVFSPATNARFFINAGSVAFVNRDYLYVDIPAVNTYVDAAKINCDWGLATGMPATRLVLFYNFGGAILSRLTRTI